MSPAADLSAAAGSYLSRLLAVRGAAIKSAIVDEGATILTVDIDGDEIFELVAQSRNDTVMIADLYVNQRGAPSKGPEAVDATIVVLPGIDPDAESIAIESLRGSKRLANFNVDAVDIALSRNASQNVILFVATNRAANDHRFLGIAMAIGGLHLNNLGQS